MATNRNFNITTAIRVRPPVPMIEDLFLDAIHRTNLIHAATSSSPEQRSDFAFGTQATQEHLFETVVKQYIDCFIRGAEHISIITYGYLFSGKTHTLFGPGVHCTDSEAYYGILPRVATYLFTQLEPNLFLTGKCKLTISAIELGDAGIKDLLATNHNNLAPNLNRNILDVQDITEEVCNCPRDIITWLNVVSNARQTAVLQTIPRSSDSSHVIVRLKLRQIGCPEPELETNTQAVFVDIACKERRYEVQPYHPLLVPEDLTVLKQLVASLGGLIINEMPLVQDNPLYNMLKPCFNGSTVTLLICCLSPSATQLHLSQVYLDILSDVSIMKSHTNMVISHQMMLLETERNNRINSDQASLLISEAESLLSKLSLSGSIPEEERDQLRNWLNSKREFEEESVNAQSHGHLECIEEVTESEEEIESSNEKMSESPSSLNQSLDESDHDDGGNQIFQISDSNFNDNLKNLCYKFNVFVDDFVDTFKTSINLTPVKERKRAYSATRRGGLPYLHNSGIVNPSNQTNQVDYNNLNQTSHEHLSENQRQACLGATSLEFSQQPVESCVEHSSSTRSGEIWPDKVEEYIQKKREREKRVKAWLSSSEYEKDQEVLEVHEVLECQISSLKTLLSEWYEQIDKSKDRNMKKTLDSESFHNIYTALDSINIFIATIENVLRVGQIRIGNPEEADLGFNHLIRCHRMSREELAKRKMALDVKVKNHTANSVEVRDQIMADEMIEALDITIEYLNQIKIKKQTPSRTITNSRMEQLVSNILEGISVLELKNLLVRYFGKTVDLRENGRLLESTISELDQKIEMLRAQNFSLSRAVQDLRTQNGSQALVRYPRPENGYGNKTGTSTTLALPGGSKGEKRLTVIPQQNLNKLQVNKPTPSAKVIIQNKKLIIEHADRKKH